MVSTVHTSVSQRSRSAGSRSLLSPRSSTRPKAAKLAVAPPASGPGNDLQPSPTARRQWHRPATPGLPFVPAVQDPSFFISYADPLPQTADSFLPPAGLRTFEDQSSLNQHLRADQLITACCSAVSSTLSSARRLLPVLCSVPGRLSSLLNDYGH